MDSLVPDKVATCCHPIAMKMSLVIMWLLATVLSGPPSTDHTRTTTPDKTASTKSDTSKLIYIVAGSVGGVVVVVIIVIVVLLCTLSRKREHAKEDTNGKEGRFNDDSREIVVMEDNDLYKQYADLEVDGTEHRVSAERQEVLVMEDNDMYHGFEKAESQEPAEKQQVPDVYSKVNKVTKTNNATEVQITLNIEDLYAKPNKPANGSSESSPKGSSYQNADVCSPD